MAEEAKTGSNCLHCSMVQDLTARVHAGELSAQDAMLHAAHVTADLIAAVGRDSDADLYNNMAGTLQAIVDKAQQKVVMLRTTHKPGHA